MTLLLLKHDSFEVEKLVFWHFWNTCILTQAYWTPCKYLKGLVTSLYTCSHFWLDNQCWFSVLPFQRFVTRGIDLACWPLLTMWQSVLVFCASLPEVCDDRYRSSMLTIVDHVVRLKNHWFGLHWTWQIKTRIETRSQEVQCRWDNSFLTNCKIFLSFFKQTILNKSIFDDNWKMAKLTFRLMTHSIILKKKNHCHLWIPNLTKQKLKCKTKCKTCLWCTCWMQC